MMWNAVSRTLVNTQMYRNSATILVSPTSRRATENPRSEGGDDSGGAIS